MSHAQKWVAAWKWPRFCTNPLRLTRRRSTSRGRGKAIPPLLPSKTLCLVAFLASVCVKQRFHVVFPPLSSCVCVCVWGSPLAFISFVFPAPEGSGEGGEEVLRPRARPQLASTREGERRSCPLVQSVGSGFFFFFLRAGFPLDGSSQAS